MIGGAGGFECESLGGAGGTGGGDNGEGGANGAAGDADFLSVAVIEKFFLGIELSAIIHLSAPPKIFYR
jgi:hypothetical protein